MLEGGSENVQQLLTEAKGRVGVGVWGCVSVCVGGVGVCGGVSVCVGGVGVGVGVVVVARSTVVYTASFQGFRWYSIGIHLFV